MFKGLMNEKQWQAISKLVEAACRPPKPRPTPKRKQAAAHTAAIVVGNTGQKRTILQRAAMSIARLGKKFTRAHRNAMCRSQWLRRRAEKKR